MSSPSDIRDTGEGYMGDARDIILYTQYILFEPFRGKMAGVVSHLHTPDLSDNDK